MSRNPHRVKWIGRDGQKGHWCHAPDCHQFAPNLRAQLIHADLHEPGVTPPTTGLIDEETTQ